MDLQGASDSGTLMDTKNLAKRTKNLAKRCRRFFGRTEQHSCVTVITKTLFATHHHGDHSLWVPEMDVKVIFESHDEVSGKVLAFSETMDLCLLVPDKPRSTEPELGTVVPNEPYVFLGHSCQYQAMSRESVSTGVIATRTWDEHCHALGSSRSAIGDSGGVFSVPEDELLGINVACENSPLNFSPDGTLHQLEENVERRLEASIVPSMLIDYFGGAAFGKGVCASTIEEFNEAISHQQLTEVLRHVVVALQPAMAGGSFLA